MFNQQRTVLHQCPDCRSELPVETSEGYRLPGERGRETVGLADTDMEYITVPEELEVRMW